jgi:hypothetical protein
MSLNRRRFLRGLGGIAIGLPFLELLMPKTASAAPAPSRYIVAFAGSSLGMDSTQHVDPANTGPLVGNLSRGLQPLADLGVDDVTSYVSGLEIPYGAAGSVPAGGRHIGFHAHSPCPLLSGVRSASNEGDESPQGPTSDWVIANAIGGPTLMTRPVLTYRVQPAYYRGSNGTGGDRGLMSARMNGGSLEKVPPTFSPQIAFQDMFTGFIPPDPAEAAEAQFLLERRKSIIDLVATDTEALIPKLSAADKIRMERHLDELRGLELKLQQSMPPDIAACMMLTDPGADPAIGGAVDNGDTGGYAGNGAWSDEEIRAEIFVDLIAMAFTCDLSRCSALMFTYAQCFLNMNPLYGYPTDLHEMSHFSMGGGDAGADAVADGIAWHVRHCATLMKKLRDTQDLDGASNILDNTALVLLFEGGLGYDPEQDNQGSPHSTENMAVMVGGLAGGLNQSGGQHIVAPGAHPVECINTVMGALGVPGTLGEVSGTIPGLIG